MAVIVKDFCGFETGNQNENQASTNCTVGTTPAPPSANESYVLNMDAGPSTGRASYTSIKQATAGTHFHTIGFYVRFLAGIDANADMVFFQMEGDAGTGPVLAVKGANGDLELRNSAGTVLGTYSNAFVHNQWYLIEIKYRNASPTDVKVRVDGKVLIKVTNTSVIHGSNPYLHFYGPTYNPASTADVDTAFASYYFITDAGSSMDANDSWLGTYSVIGPYNDTNSTSQSADFGNNLNAGTWANTSDRPQNDATLARYTAVGAINDGGGCTCNDGANVGPSGDARLTGTLKAAKWIWRAKNRGPGNQNLIGKYGAHTVATTDNTVNTGTFTLTAAMQDFQVVTDASDGNCPTTSEWMQFGFKKTHAGPFGVADLELGEFWGFVLHQEPVAAITIPPIGQTGVIRGGG